MLKETVIASAQSNRAIRDLLVSSAFRLVRGKKARRTNDPFFTPDGARAYLRDVPEAELHLFNTGHFALEEKLPEIANNVWEFMGRSMTI